MGQVVMMKNIPLVKAMISETHYRSVPSKEMIELLMNVNEGITYEEMADRLGVDQYEIRRELGLF